MDLLTQGCFSAIIGVTCAIGWISLGHPRRAQVMLLWALLQLLILLSNLPRL